MIGDKITLSAKYLEPAKHILDHIPMQNGFTISVAGESGSGKSTLALALQQVMEERGLKSVVLHMDDYFILPPATNHAEREKDINWVGSGEVKLELLQEHIQQFKMGEKVIHKPLVNYNENSIASEELDLTDVQVLIVEGTYTSLLETDLRIFIDRTYLDTFEDRVKRARDPITPFVESVLAIEHKIIAGQAGFADIVLDKTFEIMFRNRADS